MSLKGRTPWDILKKMGLHQELRSEDEFSWNN